VGPGQPRWRQLVGRQCRFSRYWRWRAIAIRGPESYVTDSSKALGLPLPLMEDRPNDPPDNRRMAGRRALKLWAARLALARVATR
jgi:hypothetical protein